MVPSPITCEFLYVCAERILHVRNVGEVNNLPPTQIFLSACLFALIAAIATALLAFRGAGAERLVAQEAAQ